MKFSDYITKDGHEEHKEHEETITEKVKSDDVYFSEVDPKTGKRYAIPMLNYKDSHYFVKYVDYMKLKEHKPEEFNKLMNWE